MNTAAEVSKMYVAVNCIAFAFDGLKLRTLLVRRQKDPYKGAWNFPGTMLLEEENARDCAIRIIKGAYGFSPASLRQFGVLTAVHRDPRARIISIGYYALIRDVPVPDDDPEADMRWVSIDELPELAFDHRRMFDMAMDSLRKSVHFEPAAFELMPEVFSLPDLQKLYETILGTTFDRRNFQKKMLSLGIIDEVMDEDDFEMDISPRRLKRFSIDALWDGKKPIAKDTSAASVSADPYIPASTSTWSRRALHYRFNRDRYKIFKENGYRLEF